MHGFEAPNIIHANRLSENLADIQEKERCEVVLANPPFGGKERKEVSVNNPSGGQVVVHRSPQDIMDEIAALDAESAEVLETIRVLL